MLAATKAFPSAEPASASQFVRGAAVGVQLTPESVERKIVPPFAAAASFWPSAEHATPKKLQLVKLAGVHVKPESFDTKTPPGEELPAIILVPSAEQATLPYAPPGTPVAFQVPPAFVDT
jgi:hypothetical protein